MRKHLWRIAAVTLAVLALSELFARYHLGLGMPPLYTAHAQIEYLYRPNQDVRRFGNRFATNRYGMRSPDFPPLKAQDEFRLMVFGDSVINGGSLTDQQDLATQIVARQVAARIDARITVGNISAGSWGPGNWLAYVREYGFLDADVVALVISSHDYADNPTFATLSPDTHPTRQPFSALAEGLMRYLPRHLRLDRAASSSDEYDAAPEPDAADIDKGLADLKAFLTLAKQKSKTVLVLQHPEKTELMRGRSRPGYSRIQSMCGELQVEASSLAPYFREAIARGAQPYRDNIHPNAIGQQLLAQALLDAVSRQTLPVQPHTRAQ